MKTVITLIALLSFSLASANSEEVKIEKVEVIEMPVKAEVARLYKFKNSRIKKALNFETKKVTKLC
ncbi:hypothetical protein Molly5_7 [Maribacter phage Molly_5]|uniref:Uncharacterized protein n=2 Tax=Mollyvirus TaxID=2948826 RepID=A0A8E4UY10_9CAUD|nr:hypothetical protein M1M29_gp007 [Maribacter phage Molly_1]YP_010357255.1 hypothetical protein M1M30_gp006 [Maribacter phage Colly_1]QQO97755.1 hypothetical protein Molly2_7 [Maribacter phage Molly_2]QQO97955.1 hypothetical protein Molly3_7 [Maribacter phage Molly_3]QQO98155.1 hypothetical protein Molly4_7 [Maribacter phage Molly_4]QQO98355.1 hypothetical protein Molly5_7 [Maribacter phage Molly_5]QQO97344.1 hypothetical protein Colly1_6 [Maribacter phage Colly_1]